MLARLFAWLQYVLPKYLLTAMVYRIARIRNVSFKNFLIAKFSAFYGVDIDEVKLTVPDDFATFNEFFIRELEDDARSIASGQAAVCSPADGTVSSAGSILSDSLFQAKGHDYSLDDLLATDLQQSSRFVDGKYATIYLAPYNYHRVHAPYDGQIVAAHYVPGDLFSVNAATAAHVPGLFRRNERLVLHFKSSHGPYVLVFVGALNVGSITTPWSGEIRPRKKGTVETIELGEGPHDIRKGELLGWFNMGSTVIVLFPPDSCDWADTLTSGSTVRMGESIGSMTSQ